MSVKHKKDTLNTQANFNQAPQSWGQEEILKESRKKRNDTKYSVLNLRMITGIELLAF